MRSGNLRGITIIEILIVILLIGILAAVGVPALVQQIRESQIKTASEELYQSLVLARSEALKQHTNMYFMISAGNTWCYGSQLGSSCDCTQSSSCSFKQVSSSSYNSNIVFSASGVSNNTIIFDGVRGTVNQTGSMTFTLNNLVITTNLGQMGNLTVCSTNVWGYPTC